MIPVFSCPSSSQGKTPDTKAVEDYNILGGFLNKTHHYESIEKSLKTRNVNEKHNIQYIYNHFVCPNIIENTKKWHVLVKAMEW